MRGFRIGSYGGGEARVTYNKIVKEHRKIFGKKSKYQIHYPSDGLSKSDYDSMSADMLIEISKHKEGPKYEFLMSERWQKQKQKQKRKE